MLSAAEKIQGTVPGFGFGGMPRVVILRRVLAARAPEGGGRRHELVAVRARPNSGYPGHQGHGLVILLEPLSLDHIQVLDGRYPAIGFSLSHRSFHPFVCLVQTS